MEDFPSHRPDPWFRDEVDDYNDVKTDDERRRILLRFGYDDAHKSEVERLFPPPDVAASREDDQNSNEPHESERHDTEALRQSSYLSPLCSSPRKIPDKKKITKRLLYVGSVAGALLAIRDLVLPVLKALYKIFCQ